MSRTGDDEDTDGAPAGRLSGRTIARLRRTPVPVYGRTNKINKNNNNGESSDDSDNVWSPHRDPLHRPSKLTWRNHWQPTPAIRLPNTQRHNNNGKCSSDTLRCQR